MILDLVAAASSAIRFDQLGLSPVALDLGFFTLKWYSLAYLAGFLLLSVSESVLMSHQDLPWTLFVAVLARNLVSDRTT